jgi:GNAT superfamily N-acetyltransferase
MMLERFMSAKHFVIREANSGDAPVLAELATELGYPTNESETAERLGRVLESPEHHVLVAENEAREVVGWVHVFDTVRLESEAFAELGGLVVSERWRGRGAGTRLVEAAAAWATGTGNLKLRIRSRVERAEAHRLFERLGFEVRKTQRVFDRPLTTDG